MLSDTYRIFETVNTLRAIANIIAFLLSLGKVFRHENGEFRHDFAKFPVPVVPFEMFGAGIISR